MCEAAATTADAQLPRQERRNRFLREIQVRRCWRQKSFGKFADASLTLEEVSIQTYRCLISADSAHSYGQSRKQ